MMALALHRRHLRASICIYVKTNIYENILKYHVCQNTYIGQRNICPKDWTSTRSVRALVLAPPAAPPNYKQNIIIIFTFDKMNLYVW